MTMDPELDAASVLMAPPDISDPEAARFVAVLTRDHRSSAIVETEGRVTFADSIITAVDGTEIGVRIYTPNFSRGVKAGVVYFHGGAFVVGDLDYEHARCLRYAADAGCVVVSVDYRLAPEHKFPLGLEDCYSGLVWTYQNARDINVDPARIAVAGASAGGCLAAAVALLARDRGGPPIALQILLYPVLDDRMGTPSMLAFNDTPVWNNVSNAEMWKHYLALPEDASIYAAPGRAEDLSDLPSAYILAVELDPLRDEALDYATRLLAAGVKVELHHVAGAYHGFDHDVPDAAISRRWMNDQSSYVRRFLRH
ncbi:alpha/beta hydrolase [Leifsonia sp. SIMBA_070]|uniref:alpha/beta hydrolase n=1 Tax=Leifsonia sp. SIMBA_070 TaxID=3085810 RepID=UPI00397BF1DE